MHSPIQKLTSACVGSPTILTNQSIMTPLIIVLKMEEKKKVMMFWNDVKVTK